MPERIAVPRYNIDLLFQPVIVKILKNAMRFVVTGRSEYFLPPVSHSGRNRSSVPTQTFSSLPSALSSTIPREVPGYEPDSNLYTHDSKISPTMRGLSCPAFCISFEPAAKRLLTQLAVTRPVRKVSSQLVGNMPEDHVFLFPNCSERRSSNAWIFSLMIGGVAEVMPLPRKVSFPILLNLHGFRVFLRQPVRHRA